MQGLNKLCKKYQDFSAVTLSGKSSLIFENFPYAIEKLSASHKNYGEYQLRLRNLGQVLRFAKCNYDTYSRRVFYDCELLAIDNCDENFIKNYLHLNTFPRVKHILLNNNPHTYNIHKNLGNVELYVGNDWKYKFDSPISPNVAFIEKKDYEDFVGSVF